MTFSVEDLLLLSLLNNPAPKCTLQNKGKKKLSLMLSFLSALPLNQSVWNFVKRTLQKLKDGGLLQRKPLLLLSVPLQIKDSL